jgi:hypothetical protein
MKIKHLFGLAVIAAMTASCSSNEDLGTAGPGTGTNEAGVGYATFTINLPSVSGTRADAGGAEMNEGTAEEYAVKSATALIFQKYGSDEGSYQFVESVDLPTAAADWTDDTTDGITTTSKKLVAKLTNVDTKNQYYVLVLLNNNKTDGVKVDLPSVGDSYNEWNSKILTPKVDDLAASGDFYMANAPLNKAGSVTTLVTIDQNNIYPTQKAAENGTAAADVYVERGVAKMSVADPTPTDPIKVKDKATKAETESTVKFNNWALDITNKKTYAVHNIDGLESDFGDIWKTDHSNRFIGTNNRVYWGKDPNYDNKDLKLTDKDAERQAEFNFITATSQIDKDFANTTKTNPVYCLENTFNLTNMYQGQTTRVIFKAKYAPKDDAGNSLADDDETFYTIGNMTTILNTNKLKAAVNAVANPVLPAGYTIDYTNFMTKEGSHVITLADIKDADDKPLVAGTDYSGKTGTVIVDEINTKLGLTDGGGRAEAKVGINTYLQGVTYYIARVKHFGDALTEWKSGESYGDNNKQYLGRYGMLRNNWYELTVGNVYGPGYPGVPPVDPTLPDDENEKYLSVSVKILSWAKRSQKVDL